MQRNRLPGPRINGAKGRLCGEIERGWKRGAGHGGWQQSRAGEERREASCAAGCGYGGALGNGGWTQLRACGSCALSLSLSRCHCPAPLGFCSGTRERVSRASFSPWELPGVSDPWGPLVPLHELFVWNNLHLRKLTWQNFNDF
jgi:hypothetical protein